MTRRTHGLLLVLAGAGIVHRSHFGRMLPSLIRRGFVTADRHGIVTLTEWGHDTITAINP